MIKSALVAGITLFGCATTNEDSVGVRLSLAPMATGARAAAACPMGGTCLTPSELSVKMTVVYVTEDVASGTGNNVGRTQAVYASPECDGIEGGDAAIVQRQPNLGSCSIDVGLQSSSSPPQTITKSPRYIDLAAGIAAVDAALDAGRFGVAPGTYKYLRLDVGSNAPAGQFNGNQDLSPAGTAMNFRFRAPGMAAPYEIRRLVGVDVAFPSPLVLSGTDNVDIQIGYSVAGTVYEVSEGSGLPTEAAACTPLTGTPAKRYCLDVMAIQFRPELTVTPGM